MHSYLFPSKSMGILAKSNHGFGQYNSGNLRHLDDGQICYSSTLLYTCSQPIYPFSQYVGSAWQTRLRLSHLPPCLDRMHGSFSEVAFANSPHYEGPLLHCLQL